MRPAAGLEHRCVVLFCKLRLSSEKKAHEMVEMVDGPARKIWIVSRLREDKAALKHGLEVAGERSSGPAVRDDAAILDRGDDDGFERFGMTEDTDSG